MAAYPEGDSVQFAKQIVYGRLHLTTTSRLNEDIREIW